MRIVQLANFYSPHSGGLRIAVDGLREGYAAAGVEMALIVPGRRTEDRETPNGVVSTIKSPELPGTGYRVVTDARAVRRRLERFGPDVVEISDRTTLVGAARWAARRGIPSVLISHERLDAILGPRLPGWFPLARAADRYNRWLASQFSSVVCTSAFGRKEYDRVGATNTVQIPLGVELDRFRPRPSRRAEGGGIRIVCVGRLSREKRPDLAVGALRTLRSWGVTARLAMIGAGPEEHDLRRRAAGLPIDFLGHLADRELVAAELAAADVAVAPCPGETFGLAALEAMASGTPVVVTVNSGAAELVAPSAGAVTSAGPRAIARTVLDLMALPEDRRRAAARARAEQYPWSTTVGRMLALHEVTAGAPR